MRTLLILALSSLLLLPGCPLTIEPAKDENGTPIGAPCEDHSDCAVGYCETKYPEGYCLMLCDQEPCPAGSRCVDYMVPLLPPLKLCMRRCENNADCGRRGYLCRVPPDNGLAVCDAPGSS